MMNRRKFFSLLGRGTVATAVLLALPVDKVISCLPVTEWREGTALAFLHKEWNAAMKGRGLSGSPLLTVGKGLFHHVNVSLKPLQRFVDAESAKSGIPSLAFKSSKLRCDESLNPYQLKITFPEVSEG